MYIHVYVYVYVYVYIWQWDICLMSHLSTNIAPVQNLYNARLWLWIWFVLVSLESKSLFDCKLLCDDDEDNNERRTT